MQSFVERVQQLRLSDLKLFEAVFQLSFDIKQFCYESHSFLGLARVQVRLGLLLERVGRASFAFAFA